MGALYSMEPYSGAVGGESAAAASCVGQGRPMGLGFGSPFATVASEAALAAAKAGLLVLFPWCLLPLWRGMILELQGTHNFRRRTPIDTP